MEFKTGTVAVLGRHRLLCGDSTKEEDVARLVGGDRIDLLLTDPPFGVAYVEGKQGLTQKAGRHWAIENDHEQTEEEYRRFTVGWLSHAAKRMADKNSVYVFNSDKMLFALRDGMRDSGFKFAQMLIWAKTHAVVGRMDYLPQHELIAYGWHGRHRFRKAKDKSVIVYPKPSKSRWHPTMKPVGLLRRLILNSSLVGDVVYDPFGGSGSTLLACEQTERRCLMIEKDPRYCETIVTLWEMCSKQKARYE